MVVRLCLAKTILNLEEKIIENRGEVQITEGSCSFSNYSFSTQLMYWCDIDWT